MRHHLLIDEFVFLGDLRRAVEHQHFAEESILEQYKMLVLSLQFIEHPINLKGHAESEIVEKRFGHPALRGRVMRRLVFRFHHGISPRQSAQCWPSSAAKAN